MHDTAFKIEKNIPIINDQPHNGYPFKKMEVGDSFFIEREQRAKVVSAAHISGLRYSRKFSVLRNGDGYRVWRIA